MSALSTQNTVMFIQETEVDARFRSVLFDYRDICD